MNPKKEDLDSDEYVVGEDEVQAAEDSGDEIELEIVDDTPAEDRGREPLPKEVKDDLDREEDAEEYSEKVRKRISQMRKAFHDERREKEAASRELAEAVEQSRRFMSEAQQLRQQLSQGEAWALEQAKRRAELEVAQAKAEYRAAYDEADPDRIAEAQQKLAQATFTWNQANMMQPQYSMPEIHEDTQNALHQQNNGVYKQQVQTPQVDEKAREWGDRNPWFGTDTEMTSFALGVHQKLVDDGIPATTDEYYEKLDRRLRQVFPDKFDEPTESAPAKKRQPSTVVAPAGRSPQAKKVVLTQSQVRLARRLGITPEQYAKELMKESQQ